MNTRFEITLGDVDEERNAESVQKYHSIHALGGTLEDLEEAKKSTYVPGQPSQEARTCRC